VAGTIADLPEGLFQAAVNGLVPYEPGKPVEEVQRELGLERVVKLASNEGPFGPFPGALEALDPADGELNRYPDGGAYRLRTALAERHGVRFEEVIAGAGADGLIDCLSQVFLGPGDEIVCGWPSFVSYVLDARKLGAMREAIGPRTKLVYICHPNNPTGTTNAREELDDWFASVPEHVVTVFDQAYYEYAAGPDYPDAVEEYLKSGHRAVVLRTFSKIYGLAGLRIGYAVAPAAVVTAIGKVRRAFDVSTSAQAAALASLADAAETERRRRLNAEGRIDLERVLREAGLEPVVPAHGNFLFVEVGRDSRGLFESLLREGAIVRPTHGFGAPEAIRVTVGTLDEHAFLGEALARVGATALS
jgi:histidinol-phosphate aminotransferase